MTGEKPEQALSLVHSTVPSSHLPEETRYNKVSDHLLAAVER